MVNNKSLPSIRISEETLNNMQMALRKLNTNPLVIREISMQELRRLSYEAVSKMIITDTFEKLNIKIK